MAFVTEPYPGVYREPYEARAVRLKCARALVSLATVLLVTGSAAAEPVVLQLRWRHQFQFAGYYVAADRGYYRDAGLEVEIVEAAPGREPVREVAAGRAQYGVGSSDLMVARARGQRVTALAAIYQHSPLVLLALRDSGIDSVHDLANRTLAIEPESADLYAYLASEGLHPSAFHTVDHSLDVDALLRGDVDAISAYQTDEPFAVAAAGKEFRMFAPRAAAIDFYGDTLFTSDDEVEDHPERVEAFVAASLRGWHEALAHQSEAIDSVLARSTRHSRAHVEFEAAQSVPLIAPDIVEIGYMSEGRWRHIADTYASLGFVPAGFDVSPLIYTPKKGPRIPKWFFGASLAVLAAVAVIAVGWWRAHRLTKALSRANARWRAYIDASPIPVVVVVGGRHLRYANAEARALVKTGSDFAAEFETLLRRADVARALADVAAASEQEVPLRFDGTSDAAPEDARWVALRHAACDFDGEQAQLVSLVDVSARRAREVLLRREAETDPLTGAANRRRSYAVMDAALARFVEDGHAFSLAVLDVDHFKRINDAFGHDVGDRVLVRLVAACRAELAEGDCIGRFGGEEFVLVVDGGRARAHELVERIRQRVLHDLAVVDGLEVHTTVSAGVAGVRSGDDVASLLKRADQALYDAKRGGRNRVANAPSVIPPPRERS